MNLEQAGAIANVATAFVTAGGLFLVFRELRQSRDAKRSETNGKLSEQSLTILRFIAERPHLYDYFYHAKPLGTGDRHEVEVLCMREMLANYSDLVMCCGADLDDAPFEGWKRFIVETADNSPEFCKFVAEHRTWYSDELLSLLDARENRQSSLVLAAVSA